MYAASKAGIIGKDFMLSYCMILILMIGLTRSLAAEVGPLGIRVNAIIPGYIETQMTEGMPYPNLPAQSPMSKPCRISTDLALFPAMTPEAREKALDSIPLKRFGNVKEVAEAAAFLANNEYASNCTLNLDGGLSAT